MGGGAARSSGVILHYFDSRVRQSNGGPGWRSRRSVGISSIKARQALERGWRRRVGGAWELGGGGVGGSGYNGEVEFRLEPW